MLALTAHQNNVLCEVFTERCYAGRQNQESPIDDLLALFGKCCWHPNRIVCASTCALHACRFQCPVLVGLLHRLLSWAHHVL